VRERRFVLLGCPVKDVGANGLEFVELGPEDAEVEVVAQVDPGADEETEVGADEGVVEVIEGFGCL
jgi:hypothetical protein